MEQAHLVLLYLKDVFLQHIIPMEDVSQLDHVLMEHTLEVVHVFLMFHVRMDKCGIIIQLIVSVLKEQNGMVKNV